MLDIPEPKRAWYAVTVKSRHEKTAAQQLRLRNLEGYLPLYRARRTWSDRVQPVDLPLFPGYLFCRFDLPQRSQVLDAPGVTSIVGFAKTDIPVADSEIDSIQTLLRSGLPVGPWPYLRVGDPVRIEHGALAGATGILLREKGIWRVIVTVELLQRSVAVEIDRDMVVAAS